MKIPLQSSDFPFRLSPPISQISPVDGECLLLLRPEAPRPLLLLLGGGGRGGGPDGGGPGGGEAEKLGGRVNCHDLLYYVLSF